MTSPETRSARLQREASIVAGAVVVFVAGWMTSNLFHAPKKARVDCAEAPIDAAAEAVADAGTPAVVGMAIADAGVATEAGDAEAADGLPLPKDAPRIVRLGVVLVAYAGAEGASGSAPPKKEAAARAATLLETARANFSEAVRKGDPGSSDDIGRIPRGVLDPSTEAAVFRLKAADVSDVLETPRGYWIVKRLE